MISEDVIKAVKERADIVEIVGAVVTLKRAGASYKGLCPFHGEKTPSFVVNPQQNTYHCFGCQAHGDSLKFIRETQNLSFPEAVRSLGRQVGIEVPDERPLSPGQRKKHKARSSTKPAQDDREFNEQARRATWPTQVSNQTHGLQAHAHATANKRTATSCTSTPKMVTATNLLG